MKGNVVEGITFFFFLLSLCKPPVCLLSYLIFIVSFNIAVVIVFFGSSCYARQDSPSAKCVLKRPDLAYYSQTLRTSEAV